MADADNRTPFDPDWEDSVEDRKLLHQWAEGHNPLAVRVLRARHDDEIRRAVELQADLGEGLEEFLEEVWRSILEDAATIMKTEDPAAAMRDMAWYMATKQLLVERNRRRINSWVDGPGRIRLGFDVGEFADNDDAAKLILDLLRAMNNYHIAAGGNGFIVEDFDVLIPHPEEVGV
jgi:hypothetical protein